MIFLIFFMRSSIEDSTHALNMEGSEVILGDLSHYWPHNLQLDEVYLSAGWTKAGGQGKQER